MTYVFTFWPFCIYRGRTELGDVTVHNIKQLKRLNAVVFPVSYNDKFYKDVLEVGELAKLGNIFLLQRVISFQVELKYNFDVCRPCKR